MGFKLVEQPKKTFRKIETESLDLQVDEVNPVIKGLKDWIEAPEKDLHYLAGTGLTQVKMTPEVQEEVREALVSFGLGAVKLPLNRVTNLYDDPDIKSIMEEHPISSIAGEFTRDLLLLKGLGVAFRGIATMPAVAKIAEGFTKTEAVKKIVASSKVGERLLNFYDVQRYVGNALTNAATFGAWSALKEAGDPEKGQTLLSAATNIGITSAWGAGMGVISAIPNFIPRAVSAGVYGSSTTLMAGGSLQDAAFNGLLMAGFQVIGGKDVDRNIKLQAIKKLEKETYNYFVKSGIDQLTAEKQAQTALSSMISRAGGIENVLRNNSSVNMNYMASELKKMQPKYKFKGPKKVTGIVEPVKPKEVAKVEKPVEPIKEPVIKDVTIPQEQSLIEEAKKYKSAEDFLNSQEKKGRDIIFQSFKTKPDFLSEIEPMLKGKKYSEGGIIEDKRPSIKVGNKYFLKNQFTDKELAQIQKATKLDEEYISHELKKEGIVVNEKGELDRTQLTDIWNKANAETKKQTSEAPEPSKPKSVLDEYYDKLAIKDDYEIIKADAKYALDEIKEITDYVKSEGGISPLRGETEEWKALPKEFRRKGGIAADEMADMINDHLGANLETASEMIDYLNNIVMNRDALKDRLAEANEELSRKETANVYTTAKKFIKKITQGIREGKRLASDEIKELQKEITDMIKGFPIEAKDKAKMLSNIKDVNTPIKLEKTARKLLERAQRYYSASEKNAYEKRINKELKTTKPLKQGQRRVGKYDYESNKFFDEIRAINKMSKESALAEIENMPEELTTQEDIIKRKFLEYRAIPKKDASPQLYESIYKDILAMKKAGEEAKDFDDYIKRLNRQKLVDDAVESMTQISGDKNTIQTKILNGYRKGFSNMWSMLNSIGGKEFADKYNMELVESEKVTAIYEKTKDIADTAKKIYNEENIFKVFEAMGEKEFVLNDPDGSVELNRMELIDIYNSVQNKNIEKRYYDAFGEQQIKGLLSKMTLEDMLFGDYLRDVVGEYRDIHNERHIETTGRDLGFVENYWMATSEYEPSVFDDIRVQGETPSAQKERARGKVIPVPKNAWIKTQKHIAQSEHVKHISRDYERIKRLFTNRKVKRLINNKFGEGVYNTLTDQIDMLSLNKQTKMIDAVSSVFGQAVNNWVTAKIALNPSTYFRQLMSMSNYMENMPIDQWFSGFMEGISKPQETFDFMWKNAPFLEARFNRGYSEALRNAIDGAKQLGKNKEDISKFLTFLTRSGDVTAIVYGGYPMIKAGKSFAEFEQATLRSQQSGLESSLSTFQSSKNPFSRLFLAFKNTSVQYFRKMVDATIMYNNGDMSVEDYTKTMTIYAAIQPALYVLGGLAAKQAFKKLGEVARDDIEKEEDLISDTIDDIFIQMMVSPVTAIPVLDDVANYAARKAMGKNAWKVFSTPLFDDLETGFRKMSKKNITAKDYFTIAGSLIEPATGLPIKTPIRYFDLIVGKKKKKRRF